jgi:hypothetical protein
VHILNRSKVDTQLLRRLVNRAGALVHCDVSSIAVKFSLRSSTYPNSYSSRGRAYTDTHSIAWGGIKSYKKFIPCNGAFKVSSTVPHPESNAFLTFAKRLFLVICHEVQHIQDARDKKSFVYDKPNGRKLRWADRPHERRALRTEAELSECEDKYYDVLMEFAMDAAKHYGKRIYNTNAP